MDLPPLSTDPTVSVVVPARNSVETLPDAVASALAQAHAGALDVVIAVGPSDDGTEDVAAGLADEHPEVTVVDNPAGVTPAALNAAIAASTGQVVVRLDAHAVLPAGYVATAVETLRTTGAANVGGRQVPTAKDGFARAVAAAMRSPVGAGGATYRIGGEPGPVDTVYLGVFRREALEAVGGFDESLRRNQDYELNHRLREAGGTVWFDPRLAVTYRPRRTVGALWRQYWQYGAWKRRVLRRHPGSVRARQLAAPVLVTGLAATTVTGAVAGVWWPLGVLAGAYAVGVVGGAAVAAEPRRDTPAVAVALATMHLAWGTGFLTGRTEPGAYPR